MMFSHALFGVFTLVAGSASAQPVDSVASGVYSWVTTPVVQKTNSTQRVLLEGSTVDFTHLKVHATTVAAHEAPHPAHKHADEELLIIKEGELTVTIEGKTRTLGPGSIALMLPGDEHGFQNRSDQPATYYVMRYDSKQPPDPNRGQQAGGSFWVNWNDIAFTAYDKGGLRRLFDRATTMTKRFEMHATTLNPGLWSHPPHTHRPAEIILLVSGSAQESIDGLLRPARVGDLIFLASGVPHAIQNTGKEPCTYIAFQFE